MLIKYNIENAQKHRYLYLFSHCEALKFGQTAA